MLPIVLYKSENVQPLYYDRILGSGETIAGAPPSGLYLRWPSRSAKLKLDYTCLTESFPFVNPKGVSATTQTVFSSYDEAVCGYLGP